MYPECFQKMLTHLIVTVRLIIIGFDERRYLGLAFTKLSFHIERLLSLDFLYSQKREITSDYLEKWQFREETQTETCKITPKGFVFSSKNTLSGDALSHSQTVIFAMLHFRGNTPRIDVIHWALRNSYLIWATLTSTAVLNTSFRMGCTTLSLHWILTELENLFCNRCFTLKEAKLSEAIPIIHMLKNPKDMGLSVLLCMTVKSSSESCSALHKLTWFVWASCSRKHNVVFWKWSNCR